MEVKLDYDNIVDLNYFAFTMDVYNSLQEIERVILDPMNKLFEKFSDINVIIHISTTQCMPDKVFNNLIQFLSILKSVNNDSLNGCVFLTTSHNKLTKSLEQTDTYFSEEQLIQLIPFISKSARLHLSLHRTLQPPIIRNYLVNILKYFRKDFFIYYDFYSLTRTIDNINIFLMDFTTNKFLILNHINESHELLTRTKELYKEQILNIQMSLTIYNNDIMSALKNNEVKKLYPILNNFISLHTTQALYLTQETIPYKIYLKQTKQQVDIFLFTYEPPLSREFTTYEEPIPHLFSFGLKIPTLSFNFEHLLVKVHNFL